MPGMMSRARATLRRSHSQSAARDPRFPQPGQTQKFPPSTSLHHPRRSTASENLGREELRQMPLRVSTDSYVAPAFRRKAENHPPRRVEFGFRDFHQVTWGESLGAALHELQLLSLASRSGVNTTRASQPQSA